jgi:hypothetical protein
MQTAEKSDRQHLLLLLLSAPTKNLEELCGAASALLRSLLCVTPNTWEVTCSDQDLDLILRLARACDVTMQEVRYGPIIFSGVAVKSTLGLVVSAMTYDEFLDVYRGSHGYEYGVINSDALGTLRPGLPAAAAAGDGPGQGDGGLHAAEAPGPSLPGGRAVRGPGRVPRAPANRPPFGASPVPAAPPPTADLEEAPHAEGVARDEA